MLKNVYTLYCKSLERIVKFCTKDVTYFFERNKSKKNDKHLLKNYRPISLRLIYDKGLKKLIYNTMFDFSVNNHLIFLYQTCLNCINQLIPMINEIYQYFDHCLKIVNFFLGIVYDIEKQKLKSCIE